MTFFEQCYKEYNEAIQLGGIAQWFVRGEPWSESYKKYAIFKTNQALEEIEIIQNILLSSLNIDYENIWDRILANKPFPEKKPVTLPFNKPVHPKVPFTNSKKRVPKFSSPKPTLPPLQKLLSEPDISEEKYQIQFKTLLEKTFLHKAKKQEMITLYQNDLEKVKEENAKIEQSNIQTNIKFEKKLRYWQLKKDRHEIKYLAKKREHDAEENERLNEWNSKKQKHEQEQSDILNNWNLRKKEFESKQAIFLSQAKKIREEHYSEKGNIEDYINLVLTISDYPKYFPQNWAIEYRKITQTLVINYSLPDIEVIPNVKNVKYIISRNEFTQSHLSKSALNKLYDKILYQITLKSINEIFCTDSKNSIDAVVFNGWVQSVNKAIGQEVNTCVLSVQTIKREFQSINLQKVEPKECFKHLKGVGSSKLHGLTAIAPIISIDREDKRFVPSYPVADGMETSRNLAAMDWKDFENLIREIFEKEFSSNGGEVKITQASRDGGVDAVGFDPDPIRGGKIVIQAKRYTNVVGVSAVRDLYGTVVNEGAIKGILVTTADFGPESYNFSKDKPITLLNGSNLLHLLEKHGHKARIDLKEAKKMLYE